MLIANRPFDFEEPTKAVLYFVSGVFEIIGVKTAVKLEDGTLHITRHDGGFCEVPLGYLFYEFSPIDVEL